MVITLGALTWLGLLIVTGMLLLARRRWAALVRRGGLPGRIGALPVDDVPADQAPRGWKCAQLLLSPDGDAACFAGISIGCAYRADDAGTCVRSGRHRVPELGCECGFYAFDRRDRAVDLLGRRGGLTGEVVVRTLLEVELTGTVVEHERGYRAEHQRVLGAAVLPWCADCAAEGCLVRASAFGSDGAPALSGAGWAGVPGYRAERLPADVRVLEEWSCLRPLCARCAATGDGSVVLNLADVAGRLGTELTWMTPDGVPAERVLAGHRPPPHGPR